MWKRDSSDGFGGGAWSAPVQYPARIAYRQEKFTDLTGDAAVSTAVCYTEAPVALAELQAGVYVLLAASEAVAPPGDANDVRSVSNTPSGAGAMRKLWFS